MYRGPPEVTISKTSSPRGNIGYVSEVPNNPLTSLVDVAVQQPKLDLTAAIRQQQALAQMMAHVTHVTPKVSAASLVTAVSAFFLWNFATAYIVLMHFRPILCNTLLGDASYGQLIFLQKRTSLFS